jgi:glycosyltransferase involved in cell wall biosynthesis
VADGYPALPLARPPMEPLRIAHVAPPWYPVPPEGYGGIEVMIYLLAQELQHRGHHVTVIGSQGSQGDFETVALAPTSWREKLGTRDQEPLAFAYLLEAHDLVRRRAFDVVHEHTYAAMTIAAAMNLATSVVATVHGDLTEADGRFLSTLDSRVHLIGISAAQQAQVAGVRWRGMVHNAIDPSELEIGVEKDDYLVELARITPDKGQDLAIEVAKRVAVPLVLAGKVEDDDREYFETQIQPHLGEPVRWIENVAGREKARLLARAKAMLFPIQWEEPFGIAMAEAMGSGTPVLATERGAAVELVEPGVTGFLARDVDGLVEAYEHLDEIDPQKCAERARERFGPARMADGYEQIYLDEVAAARSGWRS